MIVKTKKIIIQQLIYNDASFEIKNPDSERVERFRYCKYRIEEKFVKF